MRLVFFAFFLLPVVALQSQSVFDSLRVRQSTEVYFASGKYDLDAVADSAIDAVSSFYKREKHASKVRITAHTDSVGSAEMNRRLSENRAAAVRAALVARDIPAENILATAFGEARPAAANQTETGRQRNRRATLDVVLEIPMRSFAGQIRDRETGQGIPTTLIFSTKTRRDSTRTDSVGRYSVRLPQDSVVKVEAYAAGYFFETQLAKLYGDPDMVRRMKNAPTEITLRPAKPGEKAAIQNLFFVGNEAVLLRSSEPELPKVLRFMQINPDLKIEIAGHINQPLIAPDRLPAWEQRLSERRAEMVFNYLIQNGIGPERLSWKGYGNREMLFPKPKSESEHAQNRRVEIRVLARN